MAAFSVATFVLVLGSLEVGARVLGLHDPERFGGSRLRYQLVLPPLHRPSEDGLWRRIRDPRLVDRAWPKATAERAPTRVFVFGESAVAGLGMSENASFPRALERRLQARREADAWVANCGVVALSSRQVLRIVRDLGDQLRAEGERRSKDVFVLHVGNNEFLELHADRYLEATGAVSFGMRLDRALTHLDLYAWLKQRATAARYKQLSPRSFATNDLRLPESRLVEVVDVKPAEVDELVARYLSNMRAMVEATRAVGATPVLMTVATNLEWSGKEDPSGDWVKHVAGGPLPGDPAARTSTLQAAIDRLTKDHETNAQPLGRWEALFGRAVARRANGDLEGAAADFKQAKDSDPRARRCLSRMNDGVRALAKELDVALVDAEAALAAETPGGIVGFTHLYDYVHFTPLGSERLAELIDDTLVKLGTVPALGEAGYVARRMAALDAASHDALDLQEWIGWNDDRKFIHDRDLWKHENNRRKLDARAEDGSATAVELIWAANGYATELGGEERARELYARARASDPALAAVIDANIAWLDARPR